MTKRRLRRASSTSGPRQTREAQPRTGLKLLVIIAVVGLVLLSMASLGGTGLPAATAIP